MSDKTQNINFAREKSQQITVTLPNGKGRVIVLPVPSKKDLQWSEGILAKTPDECLKELCHAALKADIWRVYFLMEKNKRFEEDVFEKDGTFGTFLFGVWYDERTPLSYVITKPAFHEKTVQQMMDTASLILSYDVDIDMSRDKKHTALFYAINHYMDVGLVKLLVENSARVQDSNITKNMDKEIFSYLNNKFPGKFDKVLGLFIDTKNTETWQKIDNFRILNRQLLSKDLRQNKIFNFTEQGSLESFHESIDVDGKVTAISPSLIEKFRVVVDQKNIRTAHEKLLENDGTPKSLSLYTRIIKPQSVKIRKD